MDGNAIPAGISEAFNLATVASGIPASATSVAANFTVVAGAANGFLTEYPTSTTTVPVASDVNWTANEIVPNFTIADTAGTGFVEVYNGPASGGATVNLVIDAFGYFTTAAPVITVAASPASVIAPATSTVTATVTFNSTVTSPDPVLLSGSGAACGTFGTQTVSLFATYETVASVYTPTATTGLCTITATEAKGGNTATTTVTTAGAVNTIAVVATTHSVPANGSATDILTATVTAAAAGSAANDTVTFTTSGTCGTVSPATGSTGPSNAAVAVTYTASATSGFCTVTAKESINGSTGSVLIDQTSSPTPSVGSLTLSGGNITTPLTVGDRATTQTVSTAITYSVLVEDSTSVPIVGDPLSFVTNGAASCGTVTPSATTVTGGTASFTYTSGTATTPVCIITVTDAETGATANLTITQTGAPNSIVIAPAGTTTLAPGGVAVFTVTATSNGVAVNADSVTVAGVASTPGACPTLTTPIVTGSTGQAQIGYVATSTVGFCSITATDGSGGTSNTVVVDQT